MKTKTIIYILSILLVFLSCKKTNNIIKVDQEKNKVNLIDSVHKTKTQNDVYINNEFYESDELVDVIILEFKETSIDSISYSLYKIRDTEAYIFSVEKFLKNDDLAKYRTIDTVNLKSNKIEVKIENYSDYKTLNLLLDKKLVKKWEFKIYSKKEQDSINSKISEDFSIEGRWITAFAKENLSEDVKYDGNKGTFFMRDSELMMNDDNTGTFFMKDSKGGYIAKILVEYNKETESIEYIGATIIDSKYIKMDWDNRFKKNSPIAVIKSGDNKKIYLEWKGFYNSKAKTIEFQKNPFNETSNTVILYNCDY
jgi:hypothetical protein